MPRQNETTSRLRDNLVYLDPLSMPVEARQPQPSGESVLSRYHPDNNRRENEGRRAYTFRQRTAKLDLTLGWELEANHAPSRIPCGVEHVGDGSVNGEAAEMVVLPAVTKSPRYVLGLLKDLVHAPKLNTDESCGFHVHVSASNISSLARMRQWAIATEHLALQVEDLAFRAVPDSRKANTYCKRIIPLSSGTRFESHKYGNSRRYHWLNIVEMFRPNGIRTIENRLLGHTHRWKYVLAWSLFSMELARRGWELSNKPFDAATHKDALSDVLLKIAKEIKPLDKRAEPIPQWVYTGLSTFGIEANAWDRPLARLSETEADLKGMPKMFYSDNQIELPNENGDECPCGCGNEGRCQSQEHGDGDCDSNCCDYCHEDGRCDGSPNCERCRDNAHEEGDPCGRRSCDTCRPQPRRTAPPAPMPEGSTVVRPIDYSLGTIQPRTGAEALFNTVPMSNGTVPVDLEGMRHATEHLRNVRIDNSHLQHVMYSMISDATMFGTGIANIVYDEASSGRWVSVDGIVNEPLTFVEPTQETERRAYTMLDQHEEALSANREHSNRPRNVLPTLPEELALPMTDTERLASDARERAHEPPTGRALTVAEIERLNRGGR